MNRADRDALASRANEAVAGLVGFPRLTADSSDLSLIRWLARNDRNGDYSGGDFDPWEALSDVLD